MKNKLKNFAKEFREFAIRGRAIDLAVGVVMGAAFSGIINSIVSNIIMPLIGIITLSGDYKHWTLEVLGAKLKFGLLFETLLNFFFIALVIFLIVKFINRIFPKKEETVTKSEEEILSEILAELKKANEKK
jgi:large conductance mechanosensitive channel